MKTSAGSKKARGKVIAAHRKVHGDDGFAALFRVLDKKPSTRKIPAVSKKQGKA